MRERIWIVGNLNGCYAIGENRAERAHNNFKKWATKKNIKERYKWFNELGARNDAQKFNSYADARRILDGIPNRTHRLKSLGNAVVPQIPEIIGRNNGNWLGNYTP